MEGDITNLFGCILTRQLAFQTLLACYYVVIDFVLMFQFFFYKILFPPRPPTLMPDVTSNFHSQHQHSISGSVSTSAPLKINRVAPDRSFQRSILSVAILLGFVSVVAGSPVDTILNDNDSTELIGQILSWVCCLFYVTSRLPQIYENHRRKSTQGINIALFTAALCGNSFYTVGIMTNPLAHNESVRRDFLFNALPYLIGSAGYFPCELSLMIER
jgi:solute carrier family 66 (lysosomal lysine-arginine transporter), member 1